jgi:cellulase
MDIWEANALAAAYTPHACNVTGLYQCTGDLCGSTGVCDKNGCSFNPYLNGAKSFYGRGLEVDTNRVFTVVTQFVTTDGTDKGALKEIRRKYVQDGKVIKNAVVNVGGVGNVSSVTDALCSVTASKFEEQGGLTEMGEALARGMVLIFSIWDDTGGFMNWLDASNSWGDAGPCNATEGNPALIAANYPGTAVTFSNIKWGEIGSTSKC